MSESKQTVAEKTLCHERERLADLAAEFLDRVRMGEDVSVQEYLAQCPDESLRKEFKEVVNLCQLMDTMVDAERSMLLTEL